MATMHRKLISYEHHAGLDSLRLYIALLVSADGKGRDELVRSITGEYNHGGIQSGGWKDKLYKAAGLNQQ